MPRRVQMNAGNVKPETPKAPAILVSLAWMLRRLVRLAITFGVPCSTLEALVKRAYIDSATQDFSSPDKPQTESRIALLTGINRSDLRRLRLRREDGTALAASLEWRVAMRWGSAPYVDARGQHLPLSRSAAAGGGVGFDELVRAETTDMRATALLERWLEMGVVSLDAGDRVCFNSQAFFHQRGESPEQVSMLAHVVGDLIQGYVANMPAPETRPLAVRVCWLDRLSAESLVRLNAAAADAMAAEARVYALGLELEAADAQRPDAPYRYTYCAFRFHAESAADPAPARSGRTGGDTVPADS